MKLATIFSFITTGSASCMRGTTLHRRAVDGTVTISSYNYTNLGGPLTWYGLDADSNSLCAQGKNQSPINIESDTVSYVTPDSIEFSIPPVDGVRFENLGTGLEVVLANGTFVAKNQSYALAQFHFHTPSEHRLNEEYFPIEVHFVFENSAGNIAVVGFLFQLSEHGYSIPVFDSIFNKVDDISTAGSFTKIGPLDFSDIPTYLYKHDIYQYSGSLTTPPCLEGITWFVSAEPLPLTVQSYNKLKKVLRFNARYTQNAPGQVNLLEVAAKQLG
ncbi:putative carbonic anhydrase [Aspergillus bertholletiae]|uniref:Carbonic anhydrase n=1 Tax=Aspergillus bertholletiae TaxID=1226010 RepID=A0A5N7APG6_9EURO|nr:putative carbonic anhydrase [Aspergillus bertholletiae]